MQEAQTAPGVFPVRESEQWLIVRNGMIELGFSKSNGQLGYVADAVSGRVVMGSRESSFQSVELQEGGRLIPLPPNYPHFYTDQPQEVQTWGAESRYLGYDVVRLPDGARFGISFGDARWRIEQQVTLKTRSPFARIDWKVTCCGESGTKLRKLVFRLPEIHDEKLLASLPGASAPPDTEIPEMPSLTYFKYGAFLRNREDTLTLGAWATDPHFMLLNKCTNHSGALDIVHEHYAAGRFEKGVSLLFGSDYIQVFHGTRDNAIENFREHYAEHGLSLDRGIAPAANNAAIWEGCVGAILFDPDFSYAPYPTLADFKADLPRIAMLGFNTIQLMPQMPFPWYTVYHYDDLHGTYGGASDEELKDFISTAKSLGLRVILDIVVHGVADAQSSRKGMERYAYRGRLFKAGAEKAEEVNRYRREHPEWFRYDENGDFHFLHTWDLDFDSPTLCRMFAEHLKRCAGEFGCDGFRIDAPYWGCEPNWNPSYPLWAGASFSRNVKMLRDAEKELRSIHPELIWYTEHEHAEWRAFMDMTYTYEESWLLWRPEPDKKLPIYEGSISARKMALWFDLRRRTLPRRDIVLQHHIDSHDSWWNEADSAFGRDKFGRGPALLLTAFCMLTDGAFLAFAGAEKGCGEFFRRLLFLRRNLPALRSGRCDYLKITTDHPSVLALYREFQGKFCIPVFNFSEETVKFKLSAADGLPPCSGVLRNAVDGRELLHEVTSMRMEDRGIELELPPNGLMILTVEQ